MYRTSYGNYDGTAPHKVFAGEQQHARTCTVDALQQKVSALEDQIAHDYPIRCNQCPNKLVDCTKAQDPSHCQALQSECDQKGCYNK
jgi:hypothetical protein